MNLNDDNNSKYIDRFAQNFLILSVTATLLMRNQCDIIN